MIRELICYKCECAKCGHSWNTKTHELPLNCAKCKSTKWNDDYEFNLPQTVESISIASAPPLTIRQELDRKLNIDELRQLIAPIGKAVHVSSAENLQAAFPEDWRFTKDSPQYDDSGRIYRQQYLAPLGKRRRSVEVDIDDLDSIIER